MATHAHLPHRTRRIGTIDAAGRLSLGTVDRILGPGLRFAAAVATKHRLIIRFLDTPDPPEGWVPAPVIRVPGRYPHLRLTGPDLRAQLCIAGLAYPAAVHLGMSIESRQIVLWRVR